MVVAGVGILFIRRLESLCDILGSSFKAGRLRFSLRELRSASIPTAVENGKNKHLCYDRGVYFTRVAGVGIEPTTSRL